jgi:hypothetical protein
MVRVVSRQWDQTRRFDMPTIVKERVDPKLASTSKANGLGVVVLLLAIAVAGALLASFFPALPGTELTPDVSSFMP